MELNRNHYFVVGIILLLLGIQLRFVESYMLTEESSRFIAERLERRGQRRVTAARPFDSLLTVSLPTSRRTIRPPRWLGWSLISVGAVLVLYSLAMKRPD